MKDHTTRRRFVASTGALAVTALAGCTDSGTDGNGEGDDGMAESSSDDGMSDSSMDEETTESPMGDGDGMMEGGNETMDDGMNDTSMDGGNETMDGGMNDTSMDG